jgi:hypothetical protein
MCSPCRTWAYASQRNLISEQEQSPVMYTEPSIKGRVLPSFARSVADCG